ATKPGATATSAPLTAATASRTPVASATDSATVPKSFQFPQKNGRIDDDMFFLGLERGQARQLLPLEELERGAAAGGHGTDSFRAAGALAGGHRVATADDGQRTGHGSDGLRQRDGAGRERLRLEHAHGAVPEDRPGAADPLGEGLGGLGADVQRRQVL